MPSIPACEPSELTAGLTWQWRRSLPDYLATDGWALAYLFSGAAGGFEVTASSDGPDHVVAESAVQTAQRPAGSYTVLGIARKGDDAFPVFRGTIVLSALPDANGPTTTADERILAAIIAALEGRLTDSGLEEVTINGRQVRYIPLRDLEPLRLKYEARVAATRGAAGGGGNPFGVRMGVVFRG